ncbi:MAG: polysaccharide deacetylase family protein [Candidatus Omnitrophica bacterium]|nr:polysaccharide deacetylase family protein [Candidatus Omnitrophota bacterium]
MRSRKYTEIRYKIAWNIGALLSLLLYCSGTVPLYSYLRKHLLKRYIILVLTYHRIHDGNEDAPISVKLETFKNQMAYLRKNFDVVSLDDLIDILRNRACLRNDVIAITFDDGWKDNYTSAFQIIKVYGFPVTIFIATDFVGKDYGLTEEEIRIMRENKVAFGAHTVSHKALSEIDYENTKFEIESSKLKIENILQKKVKYFAYPYGKRGLDFNDTSVNIVKETGYSAAFSTNNGCITSDSDIFALERVGVRNFPMFVFKVRVSGIFENKWIRILRDVLHIN